MTNALFNPEALAEYIELEAAAGLNLIDELIGDYMANSAKLADAIAASARTMDLHLLERSAHSLKSSSRLLGLETVGELAWRIENDARTGSCRDVDVAELPRALEPALIELSRFRAEHRASKSR